MENDLFYYGIIALGAFAGALASGLAGFAFAITSLGIWAHVLSPAEAAPMVVICSLLVLLSTFAAIWRSIDFRSAWVFILGGLIGVPAGVALLPLADPGPFRIFVGATLILYCGALLLSGRFPAITGKHPFLNGLVGVGGGVMGGFAGLSGVLPTIWCGLMKWPKDKQRATFQLFNAAMHSATLTLYVLQDRLPDNVLTLLGASAPALILGSALGFLLYRRINDAQFKKVLLWMLGISGVGLLLPALQGLFS